MSAFAQEFICWLKMLAPWRVWIAFGVGLLMSKFGRYLP